MSTLIGMGVLPTIPLAYADSLVGQAEKMGLHSVLVPDHLMAWFSEALWPEVGNIAESLSSPHVFMDPFTTIGAWSARTDQLLFGTAVTDPIRRPPGQLAVSALSLHHVSRGRFILGIGCGEIGNCLPYGLSFDRPVARLEEALVLIRRLWTEGRVTYDGKFWSMTDAVCRLGPYRDSFPEIWVGAHGPRMLELTGRHADGWLPFLPMRPERYAERLALLRVAAEQAGRDPGAVLAGYNTPVLVADDHDKAHAMLLSHAARQLTFALDDDFYSTIGHPHPLGIRSGTAEYVPEWLSEKELRQALERAPDPMLAHDLIIHGTPAEVARQVQAYEDAGLQYFAPLDVSAFTDISQLPMAAQRTELLRSHLTTAMVGS